MAESVPKAGGGAAFARARRIKFARAPGFTMIEMLISISIAAILMALAVPAFRYVTNSNRIAGEINGLLGDLQFARAEAIKEGQGVTVCVSTNSTSPAPTCSANNTAWQSGWIVFSAASGILRVQPAFSGTDTFVATTPFSTVTFNREGYAGGVPNGTLIQLHDITGNAAWTRCLSINIVGQTLTEVAGVNGCA